MSEYFWCTGLELGDNAGYPELELVGATITSAVKRTGTYSLHCDAVSGANAYAKTLMVCSTSRVSTRIYVYPVAAFPGTARRFARWEDASGNNYSLRLNTDGTVSVIDKTGTTLLTSSTTLNLDSWNMLQWTLNLYSTPKTDLWVNGIWQGQAVATTVLTLVKFWLGFYNSEAAAAEAYFDDVASKWKDSGTVDALYAGQVYVLQPEGYDEYTTHAWGPNSPPGSNWGKIEEIPASVLDYIYTVSYQLTYGENFELPNPVPGTAANGCSVTAIAKKLGSTANRPLAMGIKSGTTSKWVNEATLSASWQLYSGPLGIFTMSEGVINALRAVAGSGAVPYVWPPREEIAVAQLTIHIDYQTLGPNAPTNLAPTGKVLERKPVFAGDYSQGFGDAMSSVEAFVYTPASQLVWHAALSRTGTRWTIDWREGTWEAGYESGLALGGTYTWQARNCDASGHWGPFSALQTLNVNSAPTTPQSCTPSGNQTVNTLTPQLQWTHVDSDSDPQSDARLDIRRNDGTGIPFIWDLCLATDTFTRADNASSMGVDETKYFSNGWGTIAGTWGISSGEAYCATNPGTATATIAVYAAVVRLRARVKCTTAATGLVFRYVDASNYWAVKWTASGKRLRLSRVVGGVETWGQNCAADLDTAPGYSYHPVKIICAGDNISVYFHDTLIISTVDAQFNTAIRYGLWAGDSATDGRWDDFLVSTTTAEQQSYTIPAGLLSFGYMYQWSVRTRDGWLAGQQGDWNLFYCVEGPTVTIDSPTEGETITDPTLDIQWTMSAGTAPQTAYQVFVYDETQTNVLHDSGKLSGASTSYTIPAGIIHDSEIYLVKVKVWDSTPSTPLIAESALRTFDTSWPVPDPIAGVTAVADDTGNPHVDLSWETSELGADFYAYNIYRRLSGGSLWVRIAQILVKSTLTYADHNVAFASTYEYSVRQVQLYGEDLVESADSTDSAALSTVDSVYLHLATDISTYVRLRFDPGRSVQWNRDEEVLQFWGETKPVKEIGTAQWRTIAVSANLLYDDTASVAILESLLTAAKTLVYRDPRGRRLFVQLDPYSESDIMPVGWQESINLVEVAYDEEVTM